jgi:signal transduction histidine kinase
MSRRFGVECTVQCEVPLPAFKASAGIHLYRIAQEAVTNSAKHSKAKHISIVLSTENNRVRMVVADDGVGLEPISRHPAGMGLNIMEYRARLIDASFRVESLPGKGTKILCVVDKQNLVS